ncbi:extracellular solute-binding protein [Paenibacillus thiaminolyticus]|uniref:extracellular solute-binding protein n=1 Tax=Paenibacillus thiaminolyticus TaxID=49283 RepID=UPI002175D804|nr:extracellular solute-binding protein [Paenibacillus thiaminolyticus]
MKTRFMKGAAIALAAIMLLAGCSSRAGDTATDTEPAKKNTSASTKITVDSSVNDPVVQRTYKDIVAAFEEENPDIEVDLLEQLNIPVPSTFDELMAAADKIVKETNGETVPFPFSGIDDWTIGQYFDLMATPLLISPVQNEKKALLNGTFDWTKWTPLPEKFQEMNKKGYINKDVITASSFPIDAVDYFNRILRLRQRARIGQAGSSRLLAEAVQRQGIGTGAAAGRRDRAGAAEPAP